MSEHDLSSKTPASHVGREIAIKKSFNQDGAGFEEYQNAVTPTARVLRRGRSQVKGSRSL